MVRMAAVLGIPEERVASVIINPKTNRPITAKTLRANFRDELDRGLLEADLQAGRNLLALTKTNAACAIFWAKVRLGWKETTEVEVPPPAADQEEAENIYDIARRIAFTLVMGGRQGKPK